jgi:DNA helicase IV
MGLLDDLFDIFFPRKQYGTRSTTKLGVEVRSRAEQKIADHFDSIGPRYQYEKELEAGIWIFTEKVSCPDFYLPDYDVYVEYWGMVNVENNYDRSKYERAMKYKMARYHQLGVKFISIYPKNLKNLDWIFRKKFEEITGQKLPSTRK